jgi:hypothetical protein
MCLWSLIYKNSGPPMEYQLLTFGGFLVNVWGPTWDWTAYINYHMLLIYAVLM